MPALTACYFCGDAVGASLEEYDVPENAPDDDRVSVTLCAGCHGKLTALLDELPVAASASESEAESATAPPGGTTTDSASGPGSREGDAPEGARRDDEIGEDAAASDEGADAEATPEPVPDASGGSEASARSEPADDRDPVAGEQEPIFAGDDGTLLGDDHPPDEPGPESGPFSSDGELDEVDLTADAESIERGDEAAESSDPIAAPPAEGESSSTDEADATTDDGPQSTDEGPSSTGDTDAATDEADSTGDEAPDDDPSGAGRDPSAVEVSASGAGGAASRTGSDASSGAAQGGEADGPLADVSPRTYNRVVRLLQNRAFPVDRDDFEALATSAYELDHGECAAALDGAIEKGLLVERDGELHRPE